MINYISKDNYKDLFYCSSSAMLLIGTDAPDFTILDVNNAYLVITNSTRASIVNKPVFAAFPANPSDIDSENIERTIFSFNQVLTTKLPHTASNYRYDIPVRDTGGFLERYWTTVNTPVLDEKGEVMFILHSPTDVTELNLLMEREKRSVEALQNQRKQLYSTFMQAPAGIGIFIGPNFIADLINPQLCEIYGRTQDEMLGKPIFDVLSQAKGKGFEEKLDLVRTTGKPYKGIEVPVPLIRNGVSEVAYVDFVYEPYREDDGSISGVIVVANEVTDKVLTKRRLQEAEERNRMTVDAVGLGTFDLDLITSEMVTSETFSRIHGFDKPVSRSEYVAALHKNDLPIRAKALEQALKTGQLFYETRVIWKDGTIHWVRVEGKVYALGGTPSRMLGVVLDITEQKRSRNEQQKLLALVTNSVDLMSILNLDGRHAYINDAGRKLIGFETDQEVFNTHISDLYTAEAYAKLKQEIRPEVISNGKWSGKMTIKHLKTGELIDVFNNSIRIDDPESGKAIGIGAVIRDLRPENAAKEALEKSEKLLRGITSAAPTGLWQSDAEGNIIYINQTWIDWTGIPYEKQMGNGWMMGIVEEDRDIVELKFLSDFDVRTYHEVEFRINHTDGTQHWCVATGKPQYSSSGEFEGYIGAGVDITEQKLLQQQKDNFIGIASHELKTPVTSIKAYTQVLEKMLIKKGELKEAAMISKMDGQLNRLTSLIGDLLDVTKINSGRLQFNHKNFEFNPLVTDLVEDLQRTTQKHVLITNLGEPVTLNGDEERIGQVIINLITNAIKYSPEAKEIIISSKVEADQLTFCVQDFGIGIAEGHAQKVFEQFYRVSGLMQYTFPGLGLGLYISAEIIKQEGGKIWVNSKEGEGSTFCFTLPILKA